MVQRFIFSAFVALLFIVHLGKNVDGFIVGQHPHTLAYRVNHLRVANHFRLWSGDSESEEGVVELGTEITPASSSENDNAVQKTVKQVAPFLSQGTELADDVLNPDLSDPKQSRVILYIILSLLPVLFLIPLMLGSRDLIPLDALPPVDMTN